ncbi:MAG: ATP synthase F1 subunit gamma [Oscillospiraceae bacterium]|nr:ATP synthase F1 subunit gamma [Oscillospiraceae bacterium]MDO4397556.1 ATP synthase F1 subunit gamma [Oscillospiraceae bacterium]MDY2677685.1 ATP synthase F1 subunit gamma [Oscillospiraceae bacterium]
MNNTNEIKQRLKAVSETRQITNAMYLLSSSRMKKAMQNIDFNLFYMKRLRATIKDILSKAKRNNIHDKFIDDNGSGSAVFVVITSDKGLCGGYNSAVIHEALSKMKDYDEPLVISLGLMGDRLLKNAGITPEFSWYGASQHPTLNLAEQVANKLIELYLTNDYHEVYIVYTEFVNSSVQTPKCVRLLPLLRRDYTDVSYEYNYQAQAIYEPSIEKVFEHLVYQYITGFMYDVFMQSSASENIARMTAMQNATRNADEMTAALSAQLNAARQLQITNEITEIAAACEAGAV